MMLLQPMRAEHIEEHSETAGDNASVLMETMVPMIHPSIDHGFWGESMKEPWDTVGLCHISMLSRHKLKTD